ncbi:MAG: hypothetical protein IJ948_01910, partial [Clostridia bacterium]|nr:hypothetical protein [Clostridia bacterium]
LNANALSVDQITPSNEFLVYSAEPQEVADALNTDLSDLEDKIKTQGILFLATDEDNTRQIQLTSEQNDFSRTVSNLSNLSDSSIRSLLPDITGLENIKGKIVLHGEQKYVRIDLKSEEYILTQFFTVENKKLYTLSFYTDVDTSTDYIKSTFSVKSKVSDNITLKEIPYGLKTAVIIGFSLFATAFLIILFTIIKDLLKKNKK